MATLRLCYFQINYGGYVTTSVGINPRSNFYYYTNISSPSQLAIRTWSASLLINNMSSAEMCTARISGKPYPLLIWVEVILTSFDQSRSSNHMCLFQAWGLWISNFQNTQSLPALTAAMQICSPHPIEWTIWIVRLERRWRWWKLMASNEKDWILFSTFPLKSFSTYGTSSSSRRLSLVCTEAKCTTRDKLFASLWQQLPKLSELLPVVQQWSFPAAVALQKVLSSRASSQSVPCVDDRATGKCSPRTMCVQGMWRAFENHYWVKCRSHLSESSLGSWSVVCQPGWGFPSQYKDERVDIWLWEMNFDFPKLACRRNTNIVLFSIFR